MKVSGALRLSLKQLIWIGLGVIAVAFLVVMAASVSGRIAVARAVADLSDQLLPVQAEVTELRTLNANQENAYRSFMLTGDPATLQPYITAAPTADALIVELRADLDDDERASAQLDQAVAALTAWRSETAAHIATRRSGPLTSESRDEFVLTGKRIYDEVRLRMRALAADVDELIDRQLEQIRDAQRAANIAQLTAASVALVTIIVALALTQRLLHRPLATLVDEVREISIGDYDAPIQHAGPREIAEVSDAVERMRENLRASTLRLVNSERRDEQARIAADLHDRIIQRVFALGLGLTSASARKSLDLEPFIDETDEIIRDLREVIFNLNASATPLDRPLQMRAAVIDIVESSVPALGFTPTLLFKGAVDETPISPALYAAVLAVVREALSNTARHSQADAATLCVALSDGQLRITLEDNGIGVSEFDRMGSGRRNIQNRARQFGGHAEIRNADPGPGTVVDWVVPLSSDDREFTVEPRHVQAGR